MKPFIKLEELKLKQPIEIKTIAILSKKEIKQEEIVFLNTVLNGKIDIEKLYQNIIYHKIFPIVYKNIERYSIKFPDIYIEKLKKEYKNNSLKMMLFLGETASLLSQLEENNIEVIPLKGVSTSYQIYGNIDSRKSCDIDILVKEDEFLKAASILKNNGYVEIIYDGKSAEKDFEQIKKVSHHISYHNVKKRIDVELHWKKIISLNIKEYEKNINNFEVIEINGKSIKMFNKIENFLYLASHGAKHSWSLLEWLNDLNYILACIDKKGIEEILEKAEKRGCINVILQLFMMLYLIYDVEIPDELKKYEKRIEKLYYAVEYVINFVIMGKKDKEDSFNKSQKTTLLKIKYYLSLADNIKDKIIVLNKYLFVPMVDDIKSIKLNKNIKFLYYIIRPFGYIIRKLKKLFC